MLVSRLMYYISSIPTLLTGIKNLPAVMGGLLRRTGNPFVVELRNGARFLVRTPMDIWVLKEAYLDHQYERASVPIQDGWNVLDIGAGLGDFAIAVAKERPQSHLFAYEPLPSSYDLLQKNLALNEICNVRAFPFAIGKQGGVSRLHTPSSEPVKYSMASTQSQTHPDALQVETISLDQAFSELGIDHCDYIKTDCEGAEYQIFFNASPETLGKIKHICLEYHDRVTEYSHTDLARFFEKNGFAVKSIPSPVHRELGLLYAVRTGT